MSLSNKQQLIMSSLNGAIASEALSYNDLFVKIGVHNIARQFPRECWQALQEIMHGINVAPVFETTTDWDDAPDDDSEAMNFFVETIVSAMDDESDEPIITVTSLYNIIGPEALVQSFSKKVWEALTDALVDEDEAPADDDEPEVMEEDDDSDQDQTHGSRTPTLPSTPAGDGNGGE